MSAKVRLCDPLTNEPLYGKNLACFATGDKATAELLRYRLTLWRGTWALDITAGMPWLELLGTKPAPLALIESFAKTIILRTPGVAALNSYAFAFTDVRKGLSSIGITTDGGTVQTVQAIT